MNLSEGIEMGRPSRIWVEVGRDGSGAPTALRLGGTTVPVISGTIEV